MNHKATFPRRSPGSGSSTGQKPEGFSLIEIIVVIAILGILAAVAVPTVDLLQINQRTEDTLARMKAVEQALESYFQDKMAFPKKLDDLEKDLYLTSSYGAGDVFLDGWGNGLLYTVKKEQATLTSLGPDQIDSKKNISLSLDGTRLLITNTRDEIETIHVALRNYEIRRVTDGLPDLPGLWFHKKKPSAMGLLVSSGYLANSNRFADDAWGDAYQYVGSPADFVTSKSMK